VDVGLERVVGREVPEPTLDLNRVAAFREQNRGAGVAERVEADGPVNTGLGSRWPQHPLEGAYLVNAPADSVGEHQLIRGSLDPPEGR